MTEAKGGLSTGAWASATYQRAWVNMHSLSSEVDTLMVFLGSSGLDTYAPSVQVCS